MKNLEGKTPIDVAQNPEIIDIFGRYVNKIKMKVSNNSKRKTLKSRPEFNDIKNSSQVQLLSKESK